MSPNFFHDENYLRKLGIKCGKNCKIHSTVVITDPKKIELGNNVRIDAFCLIISVKKIKIGSYIHLGPYAYLHSGGGKIIIEDFAGISAGVKIFTLQDDYSGKYYTGPFNKNSKLSLRTSNILVKKYCSINTNAVVTPPAKFGTGCVVGANSTVNISLDPWKIYYGFPLKSYLRRDKQFTKNLKKNLKK